MDEVRLLNVKEQAEGCQGALNFLEALLYPLGILRWLLRGTVKKAVVDKEQRPDIGRRERKGDGNSKTRRQINSRENWGNAIALRRSYVKIEVC